MGSLVVKVVKAKVRVEVEEKGHDGQVQTLDTVHPNKHLDRDMVHPHLGLHHLPGTLV